MFVRSILTCLILFSTYTSVYAADWWNAAYIKRQAIVVMNNTSGNITSGNAVRVLLKPYNIVPELSSGNDVRVVYWNGTTNTEIARIWNYTHVMFVTQATINTNSRSGTEDYWIYWSNASAGTPTDALATVYAGLYDNFDDNSLDGAKWATETFSTGTISEVNSRIEITSSSSSGSGASLMGTSAVTTTGRRFQVDFVTPTTNTDWSFRVGFVWQKTDTYTGSRWANRCVIGKFNNDTNAFRAHYTDSNGGTLYTTSADNVDMLVEKFTSNTSYRVIYEMIDHSMVCRYFKQATGGLVGTIINGRSTYAEMDTENQWLSTNLYPAIQATSNSINQVDTFKIDYFGMAARYKPDLMPLYFTECVADGWYYTLYNANEVWFFGQTAANRRKMYKSTDRCQTASLVFDFNSEIDNAYLGFENSNSIGLYKLNETSGNAADTSTGCGDRSIVWTNSTYNTTGGKYAGAITQDGSGDYGIITRSACNSINQIDHTIDAWVYPSATSPASPKLIISQQDGSGTGRSLLYMDTDNTIAVAVGGTVSKTSAIITTANQWYHVGYSYRHGSATDCTIKIYVNGQLLLTADRTSACMESATGDYVVGTNKLLTAANSWNGRIDELHISKEVKDFRYFAKRVGAYGDMTTIWFDSNHNVYVSGSEKGTPPNTLHSYDVFRSTDIGGTFTSLNVPFNSASTYPGASLRKWGITETSNGYIYIAQYFGGEGCTEPACNGDRLFRSTNGGSTFTELKFWDVGDYHMHYVYYNSYNDKLYTSIGDANRNVYVSTDHTGATPTWTDMSDTSRIANLGMTNRNGRIIMGTDNVLENNSIRYNDADTTAGWKDALPIGGAFSMLTFDMTYDPNADTILTMMANNPDSGQTVNKMQGIFVSYDGGVTWDILMEYNASTTVQNDLGSFISWYKTGADYLYITPPSDLSAFTKGLVYTHHIPEALWIPDFNIPINRGFNRRLSNVDNNVYPVSSVTH